MTEGGSAAAKVIKAFFARDVPIDLFLPDGWSGGRPMENYHDLKSVSLLPEELIVNLKGGFSLAVRGKSHSVRETVTKLLWPNGSPAVEISEFKELIYRWPGGSSTYDGGVALFVAGG
jgi:hypothetical protein